MAYSRASPHRCAILSVRSRAGPDRRRSRRIGREFGPLLLLLGRLRCSASDFGLYCDVPLIASLFGLPGECRDADQERLPQVRRPEPLRGYADERASDTRGSAAREHRLARQVPADVGGQGVTDSAGVRSFRAATTIQSRSPRIIDKPARPVLRRAAIAASVSVRAKPRAGDQFNLRIMLNLAYAAAGSWNRRAEAGEQLVEHTPASRHRIASMYHPSARSGLMYCGVPMSCLWAVKSV